MKCISTPVSWLKLERYHLGELPEAERRTVAEHLAECPACAACAAEIAEDARSLPLLQPSAKAHRRRWLTLPRIAIVVSAAAAAALVILVVGRQGPFSPDQTFDYGLSYKGGAPDLSIARARDGAVIEDPETYRAGDRFRLFATIAGETPVEWDVVVFQDSAVYFPYSDTAPIGPGNRIPLAGAFEITGAAPAEICLLTGDGLPDRGTLSAEGRRALPRGAVCRTLTHAGEQ